MSFLPPGWSRTRIMFTVHHDSAVVPLRDPVHNVVMATCVSMQGVNAVLSVDRLNNAYATWLDYEGVANHFSYLCNNSNGALQFSLFNPPILPTNPNGQTFNQLNVRLMDETGNDYDWDGGSAIIEMDFWCYTPAQRQ